MENGFDGKSLADKFSGLDLTTVGTERSLNNHIRNDSDTNLFQVMKAVEAAEATIKQQVEENTRLRIELQEKMQELERYKLDGSIVQKPNLVDQWTDNDQHGSYGASRPVRLVGSKTDGLSKAQNDNGLGSSKTNGLLNVVPGSQPAENAGFSPFFSPMPSLPSRTQTEGEYDQQTNFLGHGMMPVAEVNNPNSLWKQDLTVKVQEHEEEIMQLRKYLADYSVKEAQIRNEKYVLEKRIAYMRLAFDQQQQDLVDAASKALSYRQDIIEENIRLTYALQDAQQERSTYVSSLLPLLQEYSLQPPVPDAQSIVSNVKVLFKHLQEKLLLTESKLKESQYQLGPWRSDMNHSNYAPQSPSHPVGANSNKHGLELVSQPSYSNGKIPVSSSDAQTTAEWDILGRHPSGLASVALRNPESDDLGRYSPMASRSPAPHDVLGNAHSTQYGEEPSKQVTFREPVSNSDMDDHETDGNQNEREPPSNWNAGYTATHDDPSSSYSPFLAPVLEEPPSSVSEVADDDPLPAIEGLQISGEAFPGQELQACGYSINGTTSCNFEWVRHLEDGSVNYIEGAKQPNYLVNADDVEAYLAIEVQPLDNRKRKGELVTVFANEHRKIVCDPDMINHIQKTNSAGHASYKVSLSSGYLQLWEPATLAIKREGYSVKGSGPSGVVFTDKFSPNMSVTIPYGPPGEFIITSSGGVVHHLRVDDSSMDSNRSRDTIVLTLRLFIVKAGERRKGKKRLLLFNK